MPTAASLDQPPLLPLPPPWTAQDRRSHPPYAHDRISQSLCRRCSPLCVLVPDRCPRTCGLYTCTQEQGSRQVPTRHQSISHRPITRERYKAITHAQTHAFTYTYSHTNTRIHIHTITQTGSFITFTHAHTHARTHARTQTHEATSALTCVSE